MSRTIYTLIIVINIFNYNNYMELIKGANRTYIVELNKECVYNKYVCIWSYINKGIL